MSWQRMVDGPHLKELACTHPMPWAISIRLATFPMPPMSCDIPRRRTRASARADELGASAFVYYGCLSGRLDQTIAAIDSMRHWSKVGKRVFGIGDLFCVAIVNPAHSLEFRPFDASSLAESSPYGSYVSVFAVGGDAHGVNERGLKYGISDFTLRGDTTRGLSNELCGDAVRIDVESGQLLVTFPLDAWSHLSAVFA